MASRQTLLDDQKDQIISSYLIGRLSAETIAVQYRVHSTTICNRLREWGVKTRSHSEMGRIYLADKKDAIINLYTQELKSSSEIGQIVGVNGAVIVHRLAEWGVKARADGRMPINHNFFSDRNESAMYWAGYIAGDGTIGRPNGNWQISVSSKDRDHLRKLRTHIESGHKISACGRGVYAIAFVSKQIGDDLIEMGITPNKSKTLSIDPEIMKSRGFVSGLIDSDGSIVFPTGRHKPFIQFGTASKIMAEQIYSLFSNWGLCPGMYKRSDIDFWTIRIMQSDKVLMFLKNIYLLGDSSILLERKKKRAYEVINGQH